MRVFRDSGSKIFVGLRLNTYQTQRTRDHRQWFFLEKLRFRKSISTSQWLSVPQMPFGHDTLDGNSCCGCVRRKSTVRSCLGIHKNSRQDDSENSNADKNKESATVILVRGISLHPLPNP